MGKREVIHIVPVEEEKDWGVRRQGRQRLSRKFSNKKDAIDYGRSQAKNAPKGQLKIHGKDGKIQEERTYNKDPYPPKG